MPHIVTGKFGASKVLFRPASQVLVLSHRQQFVRFWMLLVTNVLTKVIGSNNAHNVVKATLNALSLLNLLKHMLSVWKVC